MKRSRISSYLFMATLVLCYSCGSNESSKTEATTDTSTAATPAASSPATPASTTTTTPTAMMVVMHKVKDFNKWKASYDAHDSLRLASGIHNYVVGRGVKDSSMVLVATKVDDMGKAKAFGKGADLKQAMQKSGVVGAPTMKFVIMEFLDSGNISTTLRSRTTFTVKDWDAWRRSFDSTRNLNTDNGLTIRGYGHDADNKNNVTIVTAITDTAKASAYWKSDLLKQRRKASGVTSEPARFIYEMVQRY
jgi:hypothetical protein